MLEHCCGDFLRFNHKSINEVVTCLIRRSNSSQRCSVGMKSLFCAGQSSSSTLILNYFCMDLTLCTGALPCWNRKGPSPNCCHKVGSTELSRISLYAVALRFPFTGLAWAMKNIPRPLFLHYQTLHLALCIWAGSVLLPTANPRFVHWTARWWRVIHHSKEGISTAPVSNGGEIYTTPADAWHCAWWSSASNRAWKLISWSSRRTFLVVT